MGAGRAGLVLLCLALSTAGDTAARVALVLGAHGDGGGAAGVATTLAVFALPTVLLVGVSGRLAGRPDVRPVLVLATSVQLCAAISLAHSDGWTATLVGVLALQGGHAAASATWLVSLPQLVPDDLGGAVMATHQALVGIAVPAGAAVGGLLVDRAGAAAPFVLDAVSFVPLLGACLLVPRAARPAPDGRRPSLWSTVLPVEGLAALRRQRVLAAVIGCVLVFVVTLESVNAVEVFLVRDALGATSAQFGATEAAAGAGVVVGSAAASAIRETTARLRAVVTLLGVIAAAQLVQGLAPTIGAYLVLAALVGVLMGAMNTVVMTLLVTATEPTTRGLVVALVGGAARSCSTVALAVGGVLGTVASPRVAFVVVGAAGMGIGVVARVVVRRRMAETDRGNHDRLTARGVAS